MNPRTFALLLVALLASLVGCDDQPKASSSNSTGGPGSGPPATPKEGVTITVAYGSEKKTWLEEQAKKFESSGVRTKSLRPIRIDARPMGSGEAMHAIAQGQLRAHVFSPASAVYVGLLNEAWLRTAGRTK